MTEEVQVQETTAQDEAAFEAAFAEARGDEPPTEVAQPEPETEPTAEAEPAAPEPEPEIQLSPSEIKAYLVQIDELKAQLRQVHGRYGDLNSRLTQMQQPGSPREVTAEMFEDLNAEFPELAAGIAKGLSKLPMGSQPQAPVVDLAPIRDELNQEIEKIRTQSKIDLLSMRHKGWQATRASDDFKVWEGMLPKEEFDELNTSHDAVYLAEQFDRFKEWREKAQTKRQTKTQRLEAATTPRGAASTPPTVSDEDAFMSGYKNIRRA